MLTRNILLLAAFGLCVAMTGACGDDHHHDDEGHHGDGDHHGGDELDEDCQAIMDVCHGVDMGEGEISECHTIAHDNVAADCLAEQDRCIAVCEAAAVDGGMHDGGHEEHHGE